MFTEPRLIKVESENSTSGFSVYETITKLQLIIPDDNPHYFVLKPFVVTYSQTPITKIHFQETISNPKYKPIFDAHPEIEIKSCKYEKWYKGGMSTCAHLCLFELFLERINRAEYARYIYMMCYNIDIFQEPITFNKYSAVTLGQNLNFKAGKFLEVLDVNYDPVDNYVTCSSIVKSALRYYGDKLPHKDSSYSEFLTKPKGNYTNIIIPYLKAHSEYINNLPILHENRILNTTTKVCLPILAYIYIMELNLYQFREVLIEKILKIRQAVKLIRPTETKVFKPTFVQFSNCYALKTLCDNSRFYKIRYNGLTLVIDNTTDFIQLASSVNFNDLGITKITYNHKMAALLKNTTLLNKICEINNNYAQTESGIIDPTQISNPTLSSFKSICYRLTDVEPEYRGYYVNERLLILILGYISPIQLDLYLDLITSVSDYSRELGIEISEFIQSIGESTEQVICDQQEMIKRQQEEIRQQQENIKILQASKNCIIENVNKITKHVEELEEKVKKQDEIIKRNLPIGSVEIKEVTNTKTGETQILIQDASYTLSEKANTLFMYTGIDSHKVYNKIISYIAAHPIEDIKCISKNKLFINDKDKALKYIDDIINDKVQTNEDSNINPNFDDEFATLISSVPITSQAKGKIFEYECAKALNATLWKNVSSQFLIDNNFTKQDIGIDLLDKKNKIVYQCKNYNKPVKKENITTFLLRKDKLPDYTFKLILPLNGCECSAQVLRLIGKDNIIYIETKYPNTPELTLACPRKKLETKQTSMPVEAGIEIDFDSLNIDFDSLNIDLDENQISIEPEHEISKIDDIEIDFSGIVFDEQTSENKQLSDKSTPST